MDWFKEVLSKSLAETGYSGAYPKVQGDLGYARRQYGTDHVEPEMVLRDHVGFAHPEGPWANYDVDYRLQTGYETGSGNLLTLTIDGTYMHRDDIPLLTPYELYASCKGCRGSSGGCPGLAPHFSLLKRNLGRVFVVTVHINMAWAASYAAMNWAYVYNCMSWGDLLTEKYTRRLIEAMRKAGGGFALYLGNCAGCRPVQCSIIIGGLCKHPAKRTFSCEAVGVDCDELHHMLYKEYLPWYYRGTAKIPAYMTRYAMLYCEAGVDYMHALGEAIRGDVAYIVPTDVHQVVYSVEPQIVTTGVHRGYTQYVLV